MHKRRIFHIQAHLEGITQPVSAPPNNHRDQHKQIVTPLWHLQFEEELKSHTWINCGYYYDRCLTWISQAKIPAHLQKSDFSEFTSFNHKWWVKQGTAIAAHNCTFDSSLMASLQCSGVRKQEIEEWSCTYLPLSINDGLLKNDFTFLISSIVRIINRLGSGTLLAKIDITLYHTSVSEDTELFAGGTSSMETAAFHLGYARRPTSSVADLDLLEGGLITTLACEILEAISILRWNHAYFDRINYQPYRFVFNKFSAKAC